MSLLVRAEGVHGAVSVAVPTMADALRMAAGMLADVGPCVVTVTDRASGDVLALIESVRANYL